MSNVINTTGVGIPQQLDEQRQVGQGNQGNVLDALPNPGNALPVFHVPQNANFASLNARPGAPQHITEQLAAQQGNPDAAAIVIGTGNNAKIALMPIGNVQGNGIDAKKEAVLAHVNQGAQLFADIMNGPGDNVPPTKENAQKLMWYFQAVGSTKSAISSGNAGNGDNNVMYHSGAMNIEDPDGRLEDFLNRCNSYPRASSHMKDYQEIPGCSPRGVNIRNRETPHGRKTILYAKMPTDAQANAAQGGFLLKGTGAKRMLYIKMEDNGCRKPFSGGNSGWGNAGNISGFKAFKRGLSDIKDMIKHGASFINKCILNNGRADTDNREKITSAMQTAYETQADGICNSDALNPNQTETLKNLLYANKPTANSQGIKQMTANINAAKDQAEAWGDEPTTIKLQTLLDAVKAGRDHCDIRIANEVIVTQEDGAPFF